jgi:hypothetical protein
VFTQIDFPGAAVTLTWAINDFGQIVGYFQEGPGGAVHGFVGSAGALREAATKRQGEQPRPLIQPRSGQNIFPNLISIFGQ